MGAFMGMAGLNGMLRRTLYFNGEFSLFMILSAVCGTLMFIGFLSFFYNIVMSVGLKGVIGIFTPASIKTKDLTPAG
jgi:cytochrome c oxidase subunit 1